MQNSQAKEDDKKPPRLLLVKTDSADPNPPQDWLSPMSDGDVFIGKPHRSPGPELTQYEVLRHFRLGVLLYEHSSEIERCWIVDPKLFCKTVQFYEFLNQQKKEQENGSDWSL